MLNFMLFLAICGLSVTAFLVWSDRKKTKRDNEIVVVSSSQSNDMQRLQLEFQILEPFNWNGYRNDLCLYRARMRRAEAERALQRIRMSNLRIEN